MISGLRPMVARDPQEGHRAATQLELFFDLVTVIAIASVTVTLHHAISEGHGFEMLLNFMALFAAIWWAWMNFTWFASAFDNGDPLFILLTMLVMSGAAIFAGGVETVVTSLDFSFALVGWIIMRIGMIALWLRAAHSNPKFRGSALRYAIGIAFAQALWIALYFSVPPSHADFLLIYAVIFAVELAVPVWAERATATPWHRHHMIERYGLLNIIVLGEIVVSISLMFGHFYEGHAEAPLILAAVSGLFIAFSLWWIYFLESEDHLDTTELGRAIIWGYGHVLVFAAGALVAAGLGAVMDVATHHSKLDMSAASAWVSGPIAIYLFGLWFIRDRFRTGFLRKHLLLVGACVEAFVALFGLPIWAVAAWLSVIALLRAKGAQPPQEASSLHGVKS